MTTNLGEELKKLVLAGIGALATTADKSKEIVDELVKKGELTIEQGKVMNEELKHNIKKAVKENFTVNVYHEKSTESFINDLDKLSSEELATLRKKLEEMENKNSENGNDKT